MCPSQTHRRHAFTLVEVIVALAIFAVGMIGVLDLFTASRKGAHDALVRAKSSATAHGVLETLRAAGPEALTELYAKASAKEGKAAMWPAKPEPLGQVEPNKKPNAAWQARLAPVDGHPGVMEVEVAVGWNEAAANPLNGGPGQSMHVAAWLPGGK